MPLDDLHAAESSEWDGPGSDDTHPALPEVRQVTDARTLKALAHPVRIALVEALSMGGAMTATELGEEIGESPTTCSFHLRQLAKYGFVEEAGGGKGRQRPWKMTSIGMRFGDPDPDPEAEIAAGVLGRLVRERQLERYWNWRTTRTSYPDRWREAAIDNQHVFFVTIDELEALNREIEQLLLPRFRDRMTDLSARPPDAVPVEMLVISYPMHHPGKSGGDGNQGNDDRLGTGPEVGAADKPTESDATEVVS
jgi:DNA-binding transcriptional ArsR family regulator